MQRPNDVTAWNVIFDEHTDMQQYVGLVRIPQSSC